MRRDHRLVVGGAHGVPHVDRAEHREPDDGDRQRLGVQPRCHPAELHQAGAGERDGGDERPRLLAGHPQEPDVEDGQIEEQAEGVVRVARQQDGCGQAAEQAEDCREHRAVANRDAGRHEGRDRHRGEGHEGRLDQPEADVRRVPPGVERHQARTGDRVGGGPVAFTQADLGPDQRRRAGQDHHRDAEDRGEVALVVAKLREVERCQDDEDAAGPRTAADAQHALPVERRGRWRWRFDGRRRRPRDRLTRGRSRSIAGPARPVEAAATSRAATGRPRPAAVAASAGRVAVPRWAPVRCAAAWPRPETAPRALRASLERGSAPAGWPAARRRAVARRPAGARAQPPAAAPRRPGRAPGPAPAPSSSAPGSGRAPRPGHRARGRFPRATPRFHGVAGLAGSRSAR